ncbi:MAG: RNA polymerase sporulation sigma factor SigG [Oscillospiraceae bacterium]|nr:RNA polymerase sporulation sigma factor SigG [Oscillospiraceae bacterium]MBR5722953.1 RNA polymerase sporulation sigma factor SigG [Oscillospiraceae bacterium]
MAYQKVVIAGLDTSRLAVLTEDEKMQLLREMQETGSEQAREKLILGNLRLVLSVMQRFTGRGEDPDDLFQIGVIGLMKAISNFDLSKDVRFSTYCVPMIAGELRRHLRDSHAVRVSRSLRDLAYKVLQTRERLTASLNREPTAREIAAEIGAEPSDVVAALESISDPVSLYEPIYSDSGDPLCLIDQISDPDSNESSWMSEIALRDALAALSDREKSILRRRFWQGRTQVEVAQEIGISQAQVSRIEKAAIAKIKEQL